MIYEDFQKLQKCFVCYKKDKKLQFALEGKLLHKNEQKINRIKSPNSRKSTVIFCNIMFL